MVDTHDSKMTVLGTLPIDWEVSNIQDCFQKNEKIKIGPFGSQLKKEYLLPRGDYYVYGQENVYQDDFHICYRFLSFERFNSLKSCEIRPGDFVVSTMGTIGKCAVVPDYAHVGIMDSHLVRMRFNDSLFKPFFAYLFRSRIIQEQIRKLSVGGIMEGLSTSILKKIDVIVPPIQEQKRIASALSTIDSLICELDEAISKKRHIKEGIMQQLLTGKLRLPGFSGKWEERRLDSFEIVNGSMLKSSEYEIGNVPVIAGGQTPAGFHSKANRPANTITISGSGAYAGFVSFHSVPIFASDCSTIENPKNADIIYLYFSLLSKQKEIYKCQAGGAQPHVHAKDIKDITIMIPSSVEEQKAISVVLTKSDDEIRGLETQRDKYALIKQGMMQELLTGKTRLI